MSPQPAISPGAAKPKPKRSARPFTAEEQQVFRRALENVEATANALATLCASELPLRAAARGDLAMAASQSCSVARAALRRLQPLVAGLQHFNSSAAAEVTSQTGEDK